MSIEDDMFNAFKFAGFGTNVDPTKMVRTLLNNMEVLMLTQMDGRIRARIAELQGIQKPADKAMDPYTILGVDMNATKEEVERAYKQKAKAAHPDMGGSNAEMAKINAAFMVIKQFKGWR